MKCQFTNVDTFLNKRAEIQHWIDREAPAILAINEMKPKSRDQIEETEMQLQGYTVFLNETFYNNDERGTAVYVQNDLAHYFTPIAFNNNLKDCCFLQVSLNKQKILIGCVYRHCDPPVEDDTKLTDLLGEICNKQFDLVVVFGDFNLPRIDWLKHQALTGTNSTEFKFLETLKDCYWHQMVKAPTRGRGKDHPSILDLLFTNAEEAINDLQIAPPFGKSDHSVVSFDLTLKLERKKQRENKWMYHRGDFDLLRNNLEIDWEIKLAHLENINQQWQFFKEKVFSAMELAIPKSRTALKSRFKVPFDQKTREAIKAKAKLWRIYLKTRSADSWKQYCRQRNAVRQLTRDAVRSFELEIANGAKRNPKKFWSYVNSKLKMRTGVADLIDPATSTLVSSDADKANILNKYFASVFTEEPTEPPPPDIATELSEHLTDLAIPRCTIVSKLKSLDKSKSPGYDGFHPIVLVETAEIIATPLLIIFEKTLTNGTLPDDWKNANVTAIFKKGNKSEPGNYRPVSLTSIVCKVQESILRDAVIEHLEQQKILSPCQFGFISGRSTTLQLLKVMEDWTRALDAGYNVDCIYTDFQKAFDKVPHRRLLAKLWNYGVKGNVHNWIRDFLSDRKQTVKVNGESSSEANVTSGVPQGSVLGPILFIIYINDLPLAAESKVMMFADDTKIYRPIKGTDDQETLQKDVNKLVDWSEKWLLPLHPDKAKVLTVGRRHQPVTSYRLGCSKQAPVVDKKAYEKDIGVTVDSELKFDRHIAEKVMKANRVLGMIKRSFTHIDMYTFKTLYTAQVRPHLEYAASVWSPAQKKLTTLIENVQRRATKLVPGLANQEYTDRLRALDLPSLAFRRRRGDLIETFKILHPSTGYDRRVCEGIFRMNTVDHTRGHSMKILRDKVRLDVRRHAFSQRVVDDWNSLPQSVIEASNVNSFKARLDHQWRNATYRYECDRM